MHLGGLNETLVEWIQDSRGGLAHALQMWCKTCYMIDLHEGPVGE